MDIRILGAPLNRDLNPAGLGSLFKFAGLENCLTPLNHAEHDIRLEMVHHLRLPEAPGGRRRGILLGDPGNLAPTPFQFQFSSVQFSCFAKQLN